MSNVTEKNASGNTTYYEFCLDEDEWVIIDESMIGILGSCFKWGRQAKFGIIAPDTVEVSRLEVFAKKFQTYKQEINLQIGDSITIDGLRVEILHKVENMGSVLLRIIDPKKSTVKESLFNKT